MSADISWEKFEERVRLIASHIWGCEAIPETLNGIRCDAILRPEPDRWILVEITKENTLDKLRTDLAKFSSLRPLLISQNIHAKCLFVTAQEPPPSLIETGRGSNVDVLSASSLEKRFFDYEVYHYTRSQKKFGSAVDPVSGEKDNIPYVSVKYFGPNNSLHDLNWIAQQLLQGEQIILLGQYGTGKSRCIKEIFQSCLAISKDRAYYPLAIDLRENWGLRRASEIIKRHFDELGLGQCYDPVMKIIDKKSLCLLLDGFDEIASQAWSDDPARLEAIRAESLAGVKDLIKTSCSGLLITGREHYFNSNEEMLKCLGLRKEKAIIVTCAEEFSQTEMEEYLRSLDLNIGIPEWLPRRPLVSKMLSSIQQDLLHNLLKEGGDEVSFWKLMLSAICERESRIHPSLSADTIRAVLLEIAMVSRTKVGAVGPLSLTELNLAFERVVGSPPRDEASAMLQRLPILGRVESGSSDRQFVDSYFLDGLYATALIESLVQGRAQEIAHQQWKNPLRQFGISILVETLEATKSTSTFFRPLKLASSSQNGILAGDIISALLASSQGGLDYNGIIISNSHIISLDLSETEASNLRFERCIIENLFISTKMPDNIILDECLIGTLSGISNINNIPDWIINPAVEEFRILSNIARIREAALSKEQEILVTVIQKTFFQPGAGRKEEALLRGLGNDADKRIANRVLSVLVHEGILTSFPGNQGTVYTPVRKYSRRMGKIMSELQHGSDPIWLKISRQRT